MKGKTKGERKNKSIKKNQIPAFILTGGEIKDYSHFVNNDNQNYKDAMVHAAEEVEKKLKICNENAVRLQQLKELETTNMTKLADLVQTLQTSQVENKSKIYECNTIKENLTNANNELNRLKDVEKENTSKITDINEKTVIIDDLKKQLEEAKEKDETQARETVAQNLVGNIMGDAVTNTENKEIDNKIQNLQGEKTELKEHIQLLTQQNEALQKEKNSVGQKIQENQQNLNDIQSKLNDSNDRNTELAGVISAHYDNLRQILQDQTTLVKEGVDGEGTQGNIDDSSIKDLENSGNKLQDLSVQIKELMATNQEQLHANENIRSENEQLKEANAQLTEENEKIKEGTHESLIGITRDIAAGEQKLTLIKEQQTNAEGIIKQSEQATLTVQKAQEDLGNIQTESDNITSEAQKEKAEAQKDKAEAEAAKADAEAAKEKVGEADQNCKDDLAAAELALEQKEQALAAEKKAKEEAKKAKDQCEEKLAAAETAKNSELAAAQTELAAEKKAKEDCQKELDDKILLNNTLVEASKTHDVSVKQFKEHLDKCKKELEEKSATSNAGQQQATQDMEPKYDENEKPKIIKVEHINKNTYEQLDKDLKTIITNSVSSVDKPIDTPDRSDMDYVYPRDANNSFAFKDNMITQSRDKYHLNTHKINNGMLFLFVHDKRESMANVIDDNNRQIYICKIHSIDNTNITADCWNISTSMNHLLNVYKHSEHSSEYHESKVTINPTDSKSIKFSTIPRPPPPPPKGKRRKESNINKELPKIYKELLTPIIHKNVNIEGNDNLIFVKHENINLDGIKKQNIIPVYPYGQDSFILLRRRPGDPSFQKSKNYIIYLTDYERIIKNEDKNKYFPVKENKDDTFTMFFRNSVEIRYLHALIENAKHGFLKQGDQKTLNTYAETGFQTKTQNPKDKKQEQTPQQKATRRLLEQAMSGKGGKKNLTKEYMKGGYRYSALGMKGLTIDLSGLKGKKTRRVKKKGKTVKNNKGSRKVQKGSRKDKTKKNKKRGRTYRNKNNFF